MVLYTLREKKGASKRGLCSPFRLSCNSHSSRLCSLTLPPYPTLRCSIFRVHQLTRHHAVYSTLKRFCRKLHTEWREARRRRASSSRARLALVPLYSSLSHYSRSFPFLMPTPTTLFGLGSLARTLLYISQSWRVQPTSFKKRSTPPMRNPK